MKLEIERRVRMAVRQRFGERLPFFGKPRAEVEEFAIHTRMRLCLEAFRRDSAHLYARKAAILAFALPTYVLRVNAAGQPIPGEPQHRLTDGLSDSDRQAIEAIDVELQVIAREYDLTFIPPHHLTTGSPHVKPFRSSRCQNQARRRSGRQGTPRARWHPADP